MAVRTAASTSSATRAAHHAPDLVLAVGSYHDEDSLELVALLHAEQLLTYGYADPVEAAEADYAPPHGMFLVAYDADGRAVACGGYRQRGPHGVEVKKMYTRPEHRGRGIGRRLLTELERRAAASQARRPIPEEITTSWQGSSMHSVVASRRVASSGWAKVRNACTLTVLAPTLSSIEASACRRRSEAIATVNPASGGVLPSGGGNRHLNPCAWRFYKLL